MSANAFTTEASLRAKYFRVFQGSYDSFGSQVPSKVYKCLQLLKEAGSINSVYDSSR